MFNLTDAKLVHIRSKQDIRRAATALNDLVQSIGNIRIGTAHSFGSNDIMVDEDGKVLALEVFGWTDNDYPWWKKIHEHVINSPITLACRYEDQPFWCDQNGFHTTNNNPILELIDTKDFDKAQISGPLIVAPVHMPLGNIGALGFNWMDPKCVDLDRELDMYGDFLGLCARIFITDYIRVMCRPLGPGADSSLSDLELNCLRWAAAGKTDDEIGIILSRHRGTIRFHLRNAALKLAAVNRSQTILRAAQLGYLPTFEYFGGPSSSGHSISHVI